MPMTATTATAIMMATSVVINGASGSGSGSIGPAGEGAFTTPSAVVAYELQ